VPAYVADLHNHTPLVVDYRGPATTTARDIVTSALDAGLDIFAVTDHFAFGLVGAILDAATEICAETGRELLVIPGAELRITYGADEVHITPLFSPSDYEKPLKALFDFVGFDSGSMTPQQLPHATVEVDPARVCRRILDLGGIAIIAHADRYFGDYALIDAGIFEQLLDEPAVAGVEMLDRENCNLLYGMSVSALGCSDSHALEEIGRRRTMIAMPALSFGDLKRALYRNSTVHLGGRLPDSDAPALDEHGQSG